MSVFLKSIRFLSCCGNSITEEMQLLESSVFTFCGRDGTLEFQPSANMSWQTWPTMSSIRQQHTHSHMLMCIRGTCGSIGNGSEQWNPYSIVVHELHSIRLDEFQKYFPCDITEDTSHKKILI